MLFYYFHHQSEGYNKQPFSPPKTDSKRKKTVTNATATNRLYPVLSDIESTITPVDSDNYTTETMSSSDERDAAYYQRSTSGYSREQQHPNDESFDGEDR